MKHYYYYDVTITTFYTKRKKAVYDYISSDGVLIAKSYGDAMDYILDTYSHIEERETRTIEMKEWTEEQAVKSGLEIFDVIGWNKYLENNE